MANIFIYCSMFAKVNEISGINKAKNADFSGVLTKLTISMKKGGENYLFVSGNSFNQLRLRCTLLGLVTLFII